MDDALTAFFVMRGIERLVVALIAGMSLILSWKLVVVMLEHPIRDDLISDKWRTNWKRPLIHAMRAVPSVLLAITAFCLLYLLVRPVKEHLLEVRSPVEPACVQSLKGPPTSCLNKSREYVVYEE
jgi:hypothetical protein